MDGLLGLIWPAILLVDAPGFAPLLCVASLALTVRCLGRLSRERGRPIALGVVRAVVAVFGLVLAAAIARIVWPDLEVSRPVLVAQITVTGLVLGSLALPALRSALSSAFVPAAAAAGLALLAAGALLPRGFLRAREGEVLLKVEATGQARREAVRFTPTGQPPREEAFRAHHLRIRDPGGAVVGEGWVFGSRALVSVRCYCAPASEGSVGLFRPETLTNDAPTPTVDYPLASSPIVSLGGPDVPRWWRAAQQRMLMGPRAIVVSSDYFPLVDAQGLPVRRTLHLRLEGGALRAVPAS